MRTILCIYLVYIILQQNIIGLVHHKRNILLALRPTQALIITCRTLLRFCTNIVKWTNDWKIVAVLIMSVKTHINNTCMKLLSCSTRACGNLLWKVIRSCHEVPEIFYCKVIKKYQNYNYSFIAACKKNYFYD